MIGSVLSQVVGAHPEPAHEDADSLRVAIRRCRVPSPKDCPCCTELLVRLRAIDPGCIR